MIKTQPLSAKRPELQIYSPEFLSFISGLLKPDPKTRFSAQSALQHVWITSKIKKNSNPLKTPDLKLPSEGSLFKRFIFLVISYLFVEVPESKIIRKFYQVADFDCKGFVKKEDFIRELSKAGWEADAGLAGKVFDKWDIDKDGMVQFTEFKSAFLESSEVLTDRNLTWVFEFFKEKGKDFIYSKSVLDFLGFCFVGKYKKEGLNLSVPEKLGFDEFKSLLS